jgi:hypothetical protein
MDKYMKMLIIVVNYHSISIDSNIPSPNKKPLHLIWLSDNDSVTKYFGVFWNFSDSVVYFGTFPTVWCILELFQQCGIFRNCSDSVVYFETVPTAWYILKLF